MKLLNLAFSRNALLFSFAAVVASWVGGNVIPVMQERGGWYAVGAFALVHGFNAAMAWWRKLA